MTSLEIRQKALLAASTVVLALSACRGIPQDGYPIDEDDTALAQVEADTEANTDAEQSDTAADSGAKPNCNDELTSDRDAWSDCCADLKAWCEDRFDSERLQSDCQFDDGSEEGTGCVPWGPPVPPKAGRSLA
jgi:bacillopeptidase F (M6 metalloprotease family)